MSQPGKKRWGEALKYPRIRFTREEKKEFGNRLNIVDLKLQIVNEPVPDASDDSKLRHWIVYRLALDMTTEQRKAVAAMLVAERLAGE